MEMGMSENARALPFATATPGPEGDASDCKRRVEGDLLRRCVAELQPMLHKSMRSHRIALTSDAFGVIALKSDGTFVHVDLADQEDSLNPMQVLAAAPSLSTLLDRIEAELDAAADPDARSAAEALGRARRLLEVAAVTTGR